MFEIVLLVLNVNKPDFVQICPCLQDFFYLKHLTNATMQRATLSEGFDWLFMKKLVSGVQSWHPVKGANTDTSLEILWESDKM